MKKLPIFFLIFFAVSHTKAQTYGPLGDSLLYLHNAAANNYSGIAMNKIETPGNVPLLRGAAYAGSR